MLDLIGSVLSTSIEGIGLFCLTLFIFRFKPKEDINAIIIANLLVAISNYLMEKYHIFYDFTPLLNLLVMVLVFVFITRISVIWSIVMSLVGFVGIFVLQGILILIFNLFNAVSLQELRLEDAKYILQIITGICLFFIGYYLNKKKIGFSKVPFTRYFKYKLTKFNTFMTVAFLFLLSLFTVLIKFNNVALGCTVIMLLAVVVTYALYRKEKCND